jgi:hypothetical protein
MKTVASFVLLVCLSVPLHAQTIDDGIMLTRRDLFAGYLYSHDSWDRYWEGTLERVNGNIGSVTTQTNVWGADYGVTDRLNMFVLVPYVATNPNSTQRDRRAPGHHDRRRIQFPRANIVEARDAAAIAVLSGGFP